MDVILLFSAIAPVTNKSFRCFYFNVDLCLQKCMLKLNKVEDMLNYQTFYKLCVCLIYYQYLKLILSKNTNLN